MNNTDNEQEPAQAVRSEVTPDVATKVPPEPEPAPNIDTSKPGREAAKYRTQLRETQANLEATQQQLLNLQNQVVETHIGHLKPEAWRLAVPDTTDLLNKDGTINVEKVQAKAAEVEKVLGINRGAVVPNEG